MITRLAGVDVILDVGILSKQNRKFCDKIANFVKIFDIFEKNSDNSNRRYSFEFKLLLTAPLSSAVSCVCLRRYPCIMQVPILPNCFLKC